MARVELDSRAYQAVVALLAAGPAYWHGREFLTAVVFAFFVILRVRLASAERHAEPGHDEGLPLRLWLWHPVRAVRAWLWLGYRSAPAFRAASAERDRCRDVRVAVRLAMPGLTHRTGRAVVLRELAAGRLTPADALAASGRSPVPGWGTSTGRRWLPHSAVHLRPPPSLITVRWP